MDRRKQSTDAGSDAVCQIAVMQRGIQRFFGAFAILALAATLAVPGAVHAQLQGGPEWDREARNPTALPSITPSNQNATLD